MQKVYISGAARTPLGTYRGALSGFTEQKLAAHAMLELIRQTGIDAAKIDEIIIGNSKQTSMPSNLARHAQLEAELPVEVAAYTVQRQSASGLQAVINGYLAIKCENADVILAGGSESMSQIPLEIRNARFSFSTDTEIVFDPIANQLSGAQPVSQYGRLTAADIAKTVARQYGIRQEEIDTYLEQRRNQQTLPRTTAPIVAMEIKKKKTVEIVSEDERYAEIPVIAGPADGAAMCLLCSGKAASEQNLPVKGEILAVAFGAGSPSGGGYVAERVISQGLLKAGLELDDIDYIEVSECSAAQILATRNVLKDMGLDEEEIDAKVNSQGGSLNSGLPWGAVGAVLLADLVSRLHEERKKYGMVVTPAEGGQTLAVVISAS